MSRTKTLMVFLVLLLLLSLRFFFFYDNQKQFKDKERVNFTVTLMSDPQIVGSQQRIIANLETGERILIVTALFPKYYYGDIIRVTGIFSSRLINGENKFNSIYFPKIEAIRKDPKLAIVTDVRQKLISFFSKSLPSPYSGLILGIVFGIKQEMSAAFKDSLKSSGTLHVVAASGMNVTMLGGFISSIFGYFLRRQIALVATVISIVFYAILAGLEPSIIRASIMGILVFSSQILGRQNLAGFGLILAGYIMLLNSPNLIQDIGFQLSFMATLGLIYIRPIFESNLKSRVLFKKTFIGPDVLTTVSAQFATLPIILANFGTYSLWSILANGLVLWTIPFLMVLGGVASILGIIIAPLGKAIIFLAYPLLLYFEKIVEFISSHGGAVSIEELPLSVIVGYYFVLVSLILFFRRKI